MIIGIPKEIKSDENRVSMVPFGVEELVQHGHRVLIESGAGLEFIIPPDSILNKETFINDNIRQKLAIYRQSYEELPPNPNLIKTWYHSNWKIEDYDKQDGIVTITQKKNQGILTGSLTALQTQHFPRKPDSCQGHTNCYIQKYNYYNAHFPGQLSWHILRHCL